MSPSIAWRILFFYRTHRPNRAKRTAGNVRVKPGLHFERKSTAHTQTILRTWGAFSRPPMPIYAVGIAQVPSVNTPTIRRLLRVDAGLSLVNSPQPMRIRKLLWNSLPETMRLADSLNTFKSQLKTHYFKLAYNL